MKKEQLINPFITFSVEEGEKLKLIKPIEGITDNVRQNAYWISDKCRIFSTLKMNDNETEAKELTKSVTIDGYEQQALQNKEIDTYSTYKVSRLVLTYFGNQNPNDFSKYEANHLDYDRLNNSIDNLNWLTHEENIDYSECNRDKVTDEQIIDIYNRVVINGEDIQKVANDYGRSRSTILEAAHGINQFAEKHKKLGLKYNKIHTLTEEEIKSIYLEAMNSDKNIIELANNLADKYNVCSAIIKQILRKSGRYGKYLTEYPAIDTSGKVSEKKAIEIYKDMNSGHYTLNEMKNKYKLAVQTLLDIKFCRNNYTYLKDKYKIEGAVKENDCNRTPTKLAIKVCELAHNGLSSKEIKNITGLSIDAINDIKFCRDGFEYLMDEYGIEPVKSSRPWLSSTLKTNRI